MIQKLLSSQSRSYSVLVMRMFLGIRPDAQILKDILSLQQILKEALGKEKLPVKWTKPEQIHLTLHFLGTVLPTQLDALTETVHKATAGRKASQQRLTHWEPLPRPRAAKVLSLSGAADRALSLLYAEIGGALTPLGYVLDTRPFLPHVTVGRLGSAFNFNRFAGLSQPAEIAFPVREVTLYRSHLLPGGSSYEMIKEFPLQHNAGPW